MRKIKAVSFAALCAAVVMGMGTNALAEEGSVTLTLYGDAGNVQRPYYQKMIALYEEATGNKIDLQGIDSDNFESICQMKFQTGDIPDLFLHQGGTSLDAYNPTENFYDFTDAEWVEDVAASVLPSCERNGVVYGLPYWEASYSGVIYNMKIFEELGIELPKTQEEFDAVCDVLLENGIQPIYLPVKDIWPILYQYGMDPIFEDEDLLKQLNSNEITYAEIPAMQDMIQWFSDAGSKGYFGESFATDTWDDIMEIMGEGEAAMFYCWDTWMYSDYDSESYTYTAEDFGLMPAFMGSNEEGTFEGPNVNLTIVNKNGANVEAAVEFVEFMADPENYNAAMDGFETAPVFKNETNITATPQYTNAAEWIDEVGTASIANPNIIGFSSIDGATCIQDMLVGNISVDECLAEMDEARIKAAQAQQAEGF
jgi:ABC-type glycerol-3-phosphate transport system substrate-binding protein